MNTDPEICSLAEKLQKECHEFIDSAPLSRATHQDGMNIWLFYELAKIDARLKELENK